MVLLFCLLSSVKPTRFNSFPLAVHKGATATYLGDVLQRVGRDRRHGVGEVAALIRLEL